MRSSRVILGIMALILPLSVGLGLATDLSAQARGFEAVRGPGGVLLDFAPNSVWKPKAARVRATRQAWMSQGRFDMLELGPRPQMAAMSGGVLSGTFSMPAILFGFADSDTTPLPKAPIYQEVLFGAPPLTGRPYSLTTYFNEMSNGVLNVTGNVHGWGLGDSATTYYTDACLPTFANAINCWVGIERFGEAYRSALALADSAVDFGQYDNDGPDGVPNSGDDDGVVDVVQFVQSVLGGECGGPGMWAHKFNLQWAGGIFVSNDAADGGGTITADPYVVVSGVGGTNCSGGYEPMPIGIIAHELGHGLGLPDLYDLTYVTEGIGEWGLMGSSAYTSITSPGHLSAWSKQELGWVTVRTLAASGTYSLGPVVTGDTVMLLLPDGANPRGEYYLLENKQPLGSDTANMNSGSRPKVGGLVVFHVDSQQVALGSAGNSVNTGAIHGVSVLEADGLRQLWGDGGFGKNRGDAGDAFPGSTGVTNLGPLTNPALVKNSDGSTTGWAFDSFLQLVGGVMQFRLERGTAIIVRASDTAATVSVNGVQYNRYAGELMVGSPLQVSILPIQTPGDGRSEYTFLSWSDGGAETHTLGVVAPGDSVVAWVGTRRRIDISVLGSGAVNDSLGATVVPSRFFPQDSVATLVAVPAPGYFFSQWLGDTVATGDTLRVSVVRPLQLTAEFLLPITVTGALDTATIGAQYVKWLNVSGDAGPGTYTAAVTAGALPEGMSVVALETGVVVGGVPVQLGQFDVTVTVSSNNIDEPVVLSLTVVKPILNEEDVVAHLVGAAVTLSPAEILYLDLLGNQNGVFDVGDFDAWIKQR